MTADSDNLDAGEQKLVEEIDLELLVLRRILSARYIRLWRYVDSQNVIFGFRWFDSDGDRTRSEGFGNYVGFRKATLEQPGELNVVELSPTGEHPYWHFPELSKLKPNRSGFIEAVLARGEQDHELDGLVCAGTSPAEWAALAEDGATVETTKAALARLQKLTQLYSLYRFHSAFVTGGEERWRPPSALLDTSQPQTPQRIIETLGESLGDTTSVYIRHPTKLNLLAGVGTFYAHLKAFEEPAGGDALADATYSQSLISGYASRELMHSNPATMLFPGSSDVETYKRIRAKFDLWIDAVQRLLEAKPALKHSGETLVAEFTAIEDTGSFGVFPVVSDEGGGIQALLCFASNERNFFRWNNRLVIRDASRQLSQNLPGAQPLRNLVRRVNPEVAKNLRENKDLQKKLLPEALGLAPDRLARAIGAGRVSREDVYLKEVWGFVMSVDIRRSTQLMRDTLHDRLEEYAAFVTNLTRDLADEVREHYGIFDKFTGDGILAFFPTCIFRDEGGAAGLWTIAAAEKCHKTFEDLFETLRPSLAIVETSQGLGIGIDFGKVSLVDVGGELTVVGIPVVYACRLAAAPAGMTLLNEQAFQEVKKQSGCDDFDEVMFDTKDRKLRARVVPKFWSQKKALSRKFYWT